MKLSNYLHLLFSSAVLVPVCTFLPPLLFECLSALYAGEPNMDLLLTGLEKDTSTVFTWFQNNYLKANSGKSYLLATSNNIQRLNVEYLEQHLLCL